MHAALATRRPPAFRSGTDDAKIWREVYEEDEYRLADADLVGRVVLDVGGHVGSFAAACLDRGATKVVSLEPGNESAGVYRRTLAEEIADGRCQLIQAAAWKCFGESWLRHHRFPGAHSGNTLLFQQTDNGNDPGEKVRCIDFGFLLDFVRPDALKLDCEGAEYDLLLGGGTIPESVGQVWIEFHSAVELKAAKDRCLVMLSDLGFVGRLLKTIAYDGQIYSFTR